MDINEITVGQKVTGIMLAMDDKGEMTERVTRTFEVVEIERSIGGGLAFCKCLDETRFRFGLMSTQRVESLSPVIE